MSSKSRRRPSKPRAAESTTSTSHYWPLLVGGTLVGLAIGLWLLGIVWPVDENAETALVYGGASGFFSGLLGAAATAGSLTMSSRLRWASPLVGLLFAAGFTGLVLASMGSDSAPWALIGVVGIAACVIWFYALGMVSGFIPPLFVNRFGTWVALAGGVAITIIGAVTDSLEGLTVGVLTIAAWAGIFIGSLTMRRRSGQTTKS